MPPGCASGGPAAETAEKLLHLLALLKLNLVQRKVSRWLLLGGCATMTGTAEKLLPSCAPCARIWCRKVKQAG